MAEQGSRERQGVSTVNLNALTADSFQLDYIEREKEAATKLLQLQTQNAETLAQTRLRLLDQLLKETKQRSEETDKEILEARHEQSLENIIAELEELRRQHTKLQSEQKLLQQKNLKAIRQSEMQLSNFRLSQLKLESTKRLKDIALVEQAELAAIKRRLAIQPDPSINIAALEDAEGAVNLTIENINQSLQEAQEEQLSITSELIRREAELQTGVITAVQAALADSIGATSDAVDDLAEDAMAAIGRLQEVSEATHLESTVPTTSLNSGSMPDVEQASISVDLSDLAEVESTITALSDSADATEKREFLMMQQRLSFLTTEHIQRMLYQAEFDNKYKISLTERELLEQELTERRKKNDSDMIAELFKGRRKAEAAAAEEREERDKVARQEKLEKELDFFKTLRDKETGELLVSQESAEKIYGKTFTYTQTDAGGNTQEITKSGIDMTAQDFAQYAEQQQAAINEQYGADEADTLAKAAEMAKAAGFDETADPDAYGTAIADFFEQLTLAREAEQEALANEQILFDARKKHEEKMAKENSKYAKSKVGQKQEQFTEMFSMLSNPKDFAQGLIDSGEATDSADALEKMQGKLDAMFAGLGGYITQLNKDGAQQSTKQSSVDTNLQGSKHGILGVGAWKVLNDLVSIGVGLSPMLKQRDVANKIETLAGMGISFNLKQRAFLDSFKEKIATTFEATDGTLLKLIRIQQADSTAARLGMESALTSFLNSMYETSEFMHEAANEIRGSLYEATALMTAEKATEYEYQVQKWLGSLYSVGFNASSKVAETLGKISAGDISGVTEGGMSNLLIMAANEASLPIADILEKGLTPDQTNRLMRSMVEYLASIYEETKGSNVLAQQYGNVFGVTAADLKAAANLYAKGLDEVTESNRLAKMSYQDFTNQLQLMANTAILRTSMAEIMENVKDNFNYTMAATIANNPVLSGMNYMANMLNDLVGGIEIPFINVYGFGFDLNATIADLMNVAALSGTVLGGMGKLLASLATGGGAFGSGMLAAFGVDLFSGKADAIKTRGGNSLALTAMGGSTTSESGSIAGNESGDDVKSKTMTDASEGPENQIAEAKEEQEDKENARTELIVSHIVEIYDLLQDVTLGSKKWHVQLDIGNQPSSWSTGTWTP